MFALNDSSRANVPPAINPESQLYDMQYFSISVPKGWEFQEVYGHQDTPSGLDGFMVFHNNKGRYIDIFSVKFYDPQKPEYVIFVSVKNNTEILRMSADKTLSTASLERYFRQQGYSQFRKHIGPVSIGNLSGYESVLEISNERGHFITYNGKRLDTNNYIYTIEHLEYADFSEEAKIRLNEIINSFELKSPTLSVDTVSARKPDEYYNRGKDYANRGNFTEAISDLNKVIELSPNFAYSYIIRGYVYDKQGNLTQALTDYNKGIELDPNFAEAYLSRGLIYEAQGNMIQELADLNKGIELDSQNADAYSYRGFFYYRQGNLIQALTDINKAIELNPNLAGAYFNRGSLYNQQGNFTQALVDYNKAIELKPNDAEYYFNRGSVYNQQGNSTQALVDYNKAIELNQHNANYYFVRASFYLDQKDFTHSVSDNSKAIELNPKFKDAYIGRAIDYAFLKEYDNAWADVHKAQELGGIVDSDFLNNLKRLSGRDQ